MIKSKKVKKVAMRLSGTDSVEDSFTIDPSVHYLISMGEIPKLLVGKIRKLSLKA
jgi:hypothetical protein